MNDLLDLDRKWSRAAQRRTGITLSAADLKLMEECGALKVFRVAALPIELPEPGPKASYAKCMNVLGKRTPPPWAYFLQAGETGLIKIGEARDVGKRVPCLQTASPEPLKLLAKTRDYNERELHAFYQPERIRGEWFYPSPRLLAFINQMAAS